MKLEFKFTKSKGLHTGNQSATERKRLIDRALTDPEEVINFLNEARAALKETRKEVRMIQRANKVNAGG